MAFIIINSAIQANRRKREREEQEERERAEKLKNIEKEGELAFLNRKDENDSPYIGSADYINWLTGYNKMKSKYENTRKTFYEWLKNPKIK